MPQQNATQGGAKTGRANTIAKSGRRPIEVTFPRDSLKKSLKLAESIERNNAGRAYNRLDLAQSVSMSPNSYGYRRLISSSGRYGLSQGSYKSDKIALTNLGTSIVAPKEEGEVERGLRQALLTSPLFKKVLEFYDKKRIPSPDLFKNALKREFGVPAEDIDACYEILIENMRDYGLIQNIRGNDFLQLDKLSPPVAFEEPRKSGVEEEEKLLEEVPVEDREPAVPPARPKEIFVAHGKNKRPLEQLKNILTQFKIPYRVAIDEPHRGRAISDKVAELMRACGSGIFIFTADEEAIDAQSYKAMRPSDNVVFELGAGTVLYGDKIVILREEGVSFGSDFTDYGHITFEKDRLDAKALDLIKELVGLGFLQVTPA
jgi:predicted nucleotide-binding protein